MSDYYWSHWSLGWIGFLWIGIMFLFFSNIGNWGYTYQAHRKFVNVNFRDALGILNQRYARGDISKNAYFEMKYHILDEDRKSVMRQIKKTG